MKHDDYVQLLRSLLPRGLAFAGSVYQRFIDGLSVEFARVDQRAGELSHELLPDTTTELLGDWEQIFAVTGRSAILGKLSMTGGQSLDHFREMINRATGANVTIKEFEPVAAGTVAGVPLYAKPEERPHPGWISFSIDGRYAYPDGGAVIDTRTKKVVARLPTSEKLVEIDFLDGKPIKSGHR